MATVFAACAVTALVVLAAACIQIGGAVVARHRAQTAADLSALAAAAALSGGGDACEAASRYALHNGARIAECEIDGATVLVRTRVPLPLGRLPGPDAARAVARAGWSIG